MISGLSDIAVLGILVLISGHALLLAQRRRWLAISPLNAFWGGVLVCYVIQPLLYGKVFIYWNGREVIDHTLGWILFALACVVFGYESRIGPAWAARIPHLPRRLDDRRVLQAAVLLIGLGLLGYAYLMASAGGMRQWLAIGRGGTEWGRVSAYIAGLTNLLPVGIALLLFNVEMHRRVPHWRLAVWAGAAVMWVWFAYLGSRSRTIEFGLVMLGAWFLPRRRNPPAWMLAAAFAGLFLLSGFLGAYREQFTNLSFNLDQISWAEAEEEVLPGPVDSAYSRAARGVRRGVEFNCVATIVRLVPDVIDFNHGYPLLEFLTRPVPRAFWPDKRYPALEAAYPILKQGRLSSTRVMVSKRPLLMGPAFTFVGYWYAMGGPLALLLAGFLTGCLLRTITGLYERLPSREGDVILYAHLVIIGFKEAAATPLVWVFTLNTQVLPLVLALLWSRQREEQAP